MSDQIPSLNDREIRDRIALIESMMAEGRQKTESWGWAFVLWGIAYYVAIAWATFGHSAWAWPITMVTAAILTGVIPSQGKRSSGHETIMSRAIGAVWAGTGLTLFIIRMSLAFSHHAEEHASLAMIEGMIGAANFTSALILRWRAQFAAGLAWWIAAVATCFVTTEQTGYIFLGAIFLCQIVFGTYMMIGEAAERKAASQSAGASHV